MAYYSSSVSLAPMSSPYSVVFLALCVVFNLQTASEDSSFCATCGEVSSGLGENSLRFIIHNNLFWRSLMEQHPSTHFTNTHPPLTKQGSLCFAKRDPQIQMGIYCRWMRTRVVQGHTTTTTTTTNNKLYGLSPRANYTDRATTGCRRNDCQLLRTEGVTWSANRLYALANRLCTLVNRLCALVNRLYALVSRLYALVSRLYALVNRLCALVNRLYALVSRLYSLVSRLYALVSRLYALVSRLYSLVSRLYALANRLYSLVSRLYALVSRLYALVSRLYALASRLHALANRLYALVSRLYALVNRLY
jgi:hypothetical protein